ncbi:MAG: hypothetical protein IJX14_07440 [Clostridia bacterium]|nr:hypothetical protein [Clostridia bacterium]
MYSVICVLFLTGFVFLTVLELHSPGKWLTAVEGILFAAGVLLHPVLLLVLRGFLSTFESTFAEWAWDSVETYLQYALPMLGIFFGITFFCALSSLWEKKYRSLLWRRLRAVSSITCSVVLLALAGFFAALSRTDALPLAGYIQALGISGALVLRGMYLAEAAGRKFKIQN